jgi:RNA polymerase sigma-70 factor, ECF subfamily
MKQLGVSMQFSQPPSDEILIAEAQSGNRVAFGQLYERHRDMVFRVAYRMLGSSDLAKDVTHDCFLALARNKTSFDPKRASFRTYLYSVAKNLSSRASHRLQSMKDVAATNIPEHFQGTNPLPLSSLLTMEKRQKVRLAILALPHKQREVVVLFEYEGLSLAEISQITRSTMAATKSHLFRARRQLRNELRSYLDPGQKSGGQEP